MAQVNKDLIQITGLSVNAPLVVDGGANGSYAVAAHQIKWDKSKFNGETFGGTSEGLLTAIETAIANKTVDLSNYTTYSYVTTYAANAASTAASNAVKNHENTFGHITAAERVNLQSAYEVAYFAYNRLNTFLDGEGVKDEVIETLKEIQDYISYDVAGAATMVNNIAANAEAIAANAEAIAQAKLESSEALKDYYIKDEVDGLVDALNGNIEQASIDIYTYSYAIGAVADSAASRAEQAYTNAGTAHGRANAAYTYASEVGAVADSAYSYAATVGAVADGAASTAAQAYANAGSAYDRASAAYTYAEASVEHLNKRINDIIDAGIDTDAVEGIIGDYLKDTDLSTDISYTVAFAASETGYFISGVTVTRAGAGNDYGFAFTYSYIPSPKAEDYWEEYVPAE